MTDIEAVKEWIQNKNINPITKRRIKQDGIIYKKFIKLAKKYQINDNITGDSYFEFRKNKIDPITFENLNDIKHVFEFDQMWDPFNGQRIGKDPNGSLYFNPLTLIYHFYINRTNHLLCIDDQGDMFHGDGLGNGPNFEIKGRGNHNDWYLFRLPIIDAYIGKHEWGQGVTMGPILTDQEIDKIGKLSKKYSKEYEQIYKKKLPNILLMKKYYEQAIDNNPKLPISEDFLPFLLTEEIDMLKNKENLDGLTKLIKM
jgi:hypothetical protein